MSAICDTQTASVLTIDRTIIDVITAHVSYKSSNVMQVIVMLKIIAIDVLLYGIATLSNAQQNMKYHGKPTDILS